MSADIFSITASALNAQNMRMGVIAANLANADAIAPPGQQPYRAHELVFAAAPLAGSAYAGTGAAPADGTNSAALGVQVVDTVQSNAAPVRKYDPGNPYADAQGYVTGSNVSQADEMVNLIDSANSYAASVAMLAQSSRIDQQMITSFQVS